MTTSPVVSVIIPAYNSARYIQVAIASVTTQTFTDWELVVVDDGSTDGTPGLLANIPAGRVTALRQNNAGPAAARNRGLAAARGEYVAFLDADDVWRPNYLVEMVGRLRRAPTAVAAFASWQYMDTNGELLPQAVVLAPEAARTLPEELTWRNALVPSAALVRRQAVEACRGFDPELGRAEDWDLWLRLSNVGDFEVVPCVMVWYRTHADNRTDKIEEEEHGVIHMHEHHFGPLPADLKQWTARQRRAVAYAYFNAGLAYLRQQQTLTAQRKIGLAAATWPELVTLDEFFYELACARQPRGWRGSAAGLDLSQSEALLRETVSNLNLSGTQHQRFWGQANLALARLAFATDKAPAARRYSWRALRLASGDQRPAALRVWLRVMPPAAWRRSLRQASQALRRARA